VKARRRGRDRTDDLSRVKGFAHFSKISDLISDLISELGSWFAKPKLASARLKGGAVGLRQHLGIF
jgi:hypothetical protein